MKFRLLSAHYIDGDKWLPGDKENEHLGDEKGTIVGDGTPHPIKTPTIEMAPLDEEAEETLERERERLTHNSAAGQATMIPVDQLALTIRDDFEQRFIPGFPGTPRPQKGA